MGDIFDKIADAVAMASSEREGRLFLEGHHTSFPSLIKVSLVVDGEVFGIAQVCDGLLKISDPSRDVPVDVRAVLKIEIDGSVKIIPIVVRVIGGNGWMFYQRLANAIE